MRAAPDCESSEGQEMIVFVSLSGQPCSGVLASCKLSLAQLLRTKVVDTGQVQEGQSGREEGRKVI